jgi:cell wall-associated NlpC family hydrolase
MARHQNNAINYASTVPLSVPKWCEPFIGIPYQADGHGFAGCNCWGLVHLVLKHRRGIDVDPFAETSADDIARANDLALETAARDPWREVVNEPQAFDVALLNGRPFHTGIVVAPGQLLHVWRSPMSTVMAFDNPRIRARLLGFYRHSLA